MFKPIQSSAKNDELNVWSQLQDHHVVPVNKYIYGLDIDHNTPYQYAVVTEIEIPIYICETNVNHDTQVNFKDASCCKFRSDGEMIIVGTKSGHILLISPKMKGKILQSIAAHKAEITKIEYMYLHDPIQKTSVSIGDDGTLQIWDVVSNTRLHMLAHSKEPLRGLALDKLNPNIIVTGSLDGFIRFYDLGKSNEPMIMIDTQAQINCLLFPFEINSSIILSAGKSSVSMWNLSNIELDFDNKPMPMRSITPHHMQITDMCVADAFDNGERVLFTASLDGMIKVISIGDFREIHKYDYPTGIVSVRVTSKCQYMIAAANNNLGTKNCIYTRKLKLIDLPDKEDKKAIALSKEQLKIEKLNERFCLTNESITIMPHIHAVKLSMYESLLKKNKHRSLVATMLQSRELESQPKFFINLLRELDLKNVLKRSIASQKEIKLAYLLRYIRRFIASRNLTPTCVRVLEFVLEAFPTHLLMRQVEYAKLMKHMSKKTKNCKKLYQTIVEVDNTLLSCQCKLIGSD